MSLPFVDTYCHSVPLKEIHFDTFRRSNRFVRLIEASDELILALRDVIYPLYRPRFEAVAQADRRLYQEDIVLGYTNGDEAYAYPVGILHFHEIVSHQVQWSADCNHVLTTLSQWHRV